MKRLNMHQGYTLIELIITISIISILAAIAIPAYNGYTMESRRTDARAATLEIALAQEKYRSVCPTYAANIGATIDCTTSTLAGDATSADGYYTVSITANSATAYTIAAVAVAGGVQSHDSGCTTMTVDQDSGHGSTAACW